MNIGIDIDDTISDTYNTIISYAQKYTIEDLKKSGDIGNRYETTEQKYLKFMHNWNEQEETGFFNKYYEEMILAIKIKHFAKEVIKKLHENNKIILITSRHENENKNIEQLTIKWLEENEIEYDNLILEARDKAKTAKENEIDLFIDDCFENCKKVSNEKIKTFIMDSMLNRRYNDEKITRVYSWPHIYQEYENALKGEI